MVLQSKDLQLGRALKAAQETLDPPGRTDFAAFDMRPDLELSSHSYSSPNLHSRVEEKSSILPLRRSSSQQILSASAELVRLATRPAVRCKSSSRLPRRIAQSYTRALAVAPKAVYIYI